MVAFLIVVCIYVVTGLASIKFSGFAEEVTTNVSLLSGLLASLLLFLIMVPALGWACLVSWTLYVVIVTYKMLSSGHPQQQQDNQCHDHENHVPVQVNMLIHKLISTRDIRGTAREKKKKKRRSSWGSLVARYALRGGCDYFSLLTRVFLVTLIFGEVLVLGLGLEKEIDSAIGVMCVIGVIYIHWRWISVYIYTFLYSYLFLDSKEVGHLVRDSVAERKLSLLFVLIMSSSYNSLLRLTIYNSIFLETTRKKKSTHTRHCGKRIVHCFFHCL